MFVGLWTLGNLCLDMLVPVTTTWHILPANILNKQTWKAVKGWSYRLGDGRSANNCSLLKYTPLYYKVPLFINNDMLKNKKQILILKSSNKQTAFTNFNNVVQSSRDSI